MFFPGWKHDKVQLIISRFSTKRICLRTPPKKYSLSARQMVTFPLGKGRSPNESQDYAVREHWASCCPSCSSLLTSTDARIVGDDIGNQPCCCFPPELEPWARWICWSEYVPIESGKKKRQIRSLIEISSRLKKKQNAKIRSTLQQQQFGTKPRKIEPSNASSGSCAKHCSARIQVLQVPDFSHALMTLLWFVLSLLICCVDINSRLRRAQDQGSLELNAWVLNGSPTIDPPKDSIGCLGCYFMCG